MASYYININIKTGDQNAVEQAVIDLFEQEGFMLHSSYPAEDVVEDEEMLPDNDSWYGVILSGTTTKDWTTVYVADWQDSGVLARSLSQALNTPAIEIWAADDEHWGYTYYENGQVQDRFADDPSVVAEAEDEFLLYQGQAALLSAVLIEPVETAAQILKEAHEKAGQFPGAAIHALASAVGLPFEHALTDYDSFFEDDPGDLRRDLENWAAFQHLTFTHSQGRERLSE